jgi:hypothetical protein
MSLFLAYRHMKTGAQGWNSGVKIIVTQLQAARPEIPVFGNQT